VASDADIFLGFDPGGARKFGAALVQGNKARLATLSGIGEALRWARAKCDAAIPAAAGIDTLLHWSTGPTSWRRADNWLRMKYPDARSSVISANALYGAMAIGGVGLALELRQTWSTIRLNETHPKVLYRELRGTRYTPMDWRAAADWFVQYSKLDLVDAIDDDHQLDALLSAWATREGYARGWQDLAGPEADHIYPAGAVSYLWPSPA